MYFATTFRIALGTYLLLLLAEALHPGFVSNVFSAHWILVLAFMAFVGALKQGESLRARDGSITLFMLFAALVCGVVTWRMGEGLGQWRLLLSFAGLVLPFALVRLGMVE